VTTFCTPVDNASTTLAAPRLAGATSAVVAAGDGVLFGSPSPSAPIRITLVARSAVDSNGFLGDRTRLATYTCTGRTGDTLTGLALESGVDRDFAAADFAGVLVGARSLADVHAAVNTLEAAAGSSTYTFTQVSPAATWVVAHGLGRHPSVTVVDSAGSVCIGAVVYDSANQITLSFIGGFSGNAYLN
jgi:hypothetical protein